MPFSLASCLSTFNVHLTGSGLWCSSGLCSGVRSGLRLLEHDSESDSLLHSNSSFIFSGVDARAILRYVCTQLNTYIVANMQLRWRT